ncbi:alpha/beta-hydrolase [Patellaria atrata CBS 101060]|uniref:Carboxypeptidase n=1 Tax=Patellaria atrata CBS 101060 TaxID=1346257 RepID=A0A9P4SCM4_9PEZI|nr:alpha/beta-hydrolase [Patellaria atrata CBS 101060]
MRVLNLFSIATLATVACAKSDRLITRSRPDFVHPKRTVPNSRPEEVVKRQSDFIIPQNENTTKFAVNGTAIPEVDFDVGESYAGLLPISEDDPRELYFWFFPSSNPDASEEILLWLNGGPGCSSLEGFFQENGPVLWQYGTFKPVKNPWTWVNLTNIVWVEQPVGTGFSQGNATATSTEEAAKEFLGFWKNFIDTFELHNRKVYIAGESYAGIYIPWIAKEMLDQEDTTYYNLTGTLIYDPTMTYSAIEQQIPVVPYVDRWQGLFNLNESFLEDIHNRADECGYTDFYDTYLTYPPPGPFPTLPPNDTAPGCDLWTDIYYAASLTNPCFDIYQIATTCPLLWDVLGFPGSFGYIPDGAFVYFNRTDVQKAINAPIQEWEECSNGVLDIDTSTPPGLGVLPSVIERSQRTIIGFGNLDYILMSEGALMMIQNLTWGGMQGFQEKPCDPFFVPYHADVPLDSLASAGIMGTTHTERGLTWVETHLSGHMAPQYAPSAAFRQVEFLLGRIDSLSEQTNFVGQEGDFGNGFEFITANVSETDSEEFGVAGFRS